MIRLTLLSVEMDHRATRAEQGCRKDAIHDRDLDEGFLGLSVWYTLR